MALTAAEVLRDYETDGVPSSGPHEVKKSDFRTLLSQYEQIINAFTSNGGLIYSSKASMDADLAHAANSMAWVVGDATAANNGIYHKQGASGSGSWTRVADLPYSFIVASDVGDGTPDAIMATSSLPVSGSSLVLLNIYEDNTGSPVTVSFNGGSPLTIKTNSGNDVAPGGLQSGMLVLGRVSGTTFRLVSDQVSSAIIAQAEAAQAAAEAAQAAAEAAAASVEFPVSYAPQTLTEAEKAQARENIGVGSPAETLADLKASPSTGGVVVFLTEAGREGAFTVRSGDYSAAVAADPGEGMFVTADDALPTAKVWARVDTTFLHPLMFGAEGQSDCTQAFLDCLAAADYLGKPMHILERSLSYPVQAGTNWAAAGRSILGVGHPIIEALGFGPIFKCDVGDAVGANASGLTLKSLILKGNADTIDGLYMRGMVHAEVDDIEVRNVRGAISPGVTPYSAAFNIIFAVASVFKDLQYRPDTFGQAYKADAGLLLDHSSDGYYVADTTFINPRMEGGIDRGIWLKNGCGNLFLGGTSEGCGVGVDIDNGDCNRNKFVNLWCEANSTQDLVVRGQLNIFDACNFQSAGSANTVEIPNGKATRFRDSYVRHANLQSPSANTIFDGCIFSDHPSLGITGIGPYRTYGCVKTDATGAITTTMPDV